MKTQNERNKMKIMSVIGIIISAVMLLLCLSMITVEGMYMIFATYGFFLAMSIAVLARK